MTDQTAMPDPAAGKIASEGTLPVNDLARSYQPRRFRGAGASILWNLSLATLFLATGGAEHLYKFLIDHPRLTVFSIPWANPVFIAILFCSYALLNLPLELWLGYLQERQFWLAKNGIRAWIRDWVVGTFQHGVMFCIGTFALIALQQSAPRIWLAMVAGLLLILYAATAWLSARLIPRPLFHLQPANQPAMARLSALLATLGPEAQRLPPVIIYSHNALREFAGGIVGMGNAAVMLISRSTMESASDGLLRFVIAHDLGHRYHHHTLLSTLVGWSWTVIGLVACDLLIPVKSWLLGIPITGTGLYAAWLAVLLSAWMALTQPVMAFFGRRLEYQADRFYLRNGGTLQEMRRALAELAQRNLARTESAQRTRETMFHPLPSIAHRLHKAKRYASTLKPRQ